MKTLKAFFLVSIFLLTSLTSLAYADPQSSATATLNFTLTFKDETGNVLYGSGYTTDLKTEWQHQMGYSTLSFGGSYVNIPFNEVSGVNVPVDGLDVSRTATHGTASGESGVTGSYSTGSTTLGMSNKAEVGGGLLDAKYENMYAASSVFNLIFSAGSTPVYLWIDYDYSIEFDTNVLDPTHWWEWQAGGAVRMNLTQIFH